MAQRFMKFNITMAILLATSTSIAEGDRFHIRNTIKEHQSEIMDCYKSLLKIEPTAAGKVIAEWKIDELGNATQVLISQSSSLYKNSFNSCIESKIKLWRFSKANKGEFVDIRYPFIFNPK